ncbi:MAG: hypothetical protein N4A62_03695 [Marinisporobacter sp.]|jgi:chaperonin cofactor prefoldin|nr:hypothetical protein [Marinisporobacter sp.]
MDRIWRNNEKGSAIILVLIVIIILLTLGTMALSIGIGNLRLGEKSKAWKEEYYDLDKAAEEQLKVINGILAIAEDATIRYMKYELYSKGTIPQKLVDKLEKYGAEKLDKKFNSGSSQKDKIEKQLKKIQEKLKANLKTTNNQQFVYNQWVKAVKNKSMSGSKIDPEKYSQNMDGFYKEAFPKIYYNFATRALATLQTSSGFQSISINGKTLDYKIKMIQKKKTGKTGEKDYSDFSGNWTDYNPTDDDLQFEITVKDDNGKQLISKGNVKFPVYSAQTMRTNTVIYGNPLWANAITAGGNISFENRATIKGDVFGSGSDGIVIKKGKTIDIYGNLYTSGDISVDANNGELNVHAYKPNFDVNYKKNYIFPCGYYIDEKISIMSEDDKRKLEGTYTYDMPLIYPDGDTGGNVYCNNLLLKSIYNSNKIRVEKNVITKGSVKNKSGVGSEIKMDGNYIGITSGDGSDASSEGSVIYSEGSGKIILGEKMIVPGKIVGTNRSVSDKKIENAIINLGLPNNIDYKKLFDEACAQDLIDKNAIVYIEDSGIESTHTSLSVTNNNIGGYSAGEMFIKKNGNIRYYANDSKIVGNWTMKNGKWIQPNKIIQAKENKEAYKTFERNKFLEKIFTMKTKHFGTKNKTFSDMVYENNLFDEKNKVLDEAKSGVYFYNGDTTMNLSGKDGIVYCKGNLMITGGIFQGSIICTGNVIIKGNTDITYNETKIMEKIRGNIPARKFFERGGMGKFIEYVVEEKVNPKNRKATSSERYEIIEWREQS